LKRPKTLFHILMHIGRLLEQKTNACLEPLKLHHGQARTLTILMAHGPITQADLARGMGLRPATITNMLRPLEARELIKRYTDPKTNRAIVVSLTSDGKTLAESVQNAWSEIEDTLTKAVPSDQREATFLLLESVRDQLGGKAPDYKTYTEN